MNMYKLFSFLIIIFLPFYASAEKIAIVGATIIDVVSERAISNATILLDQGKIAEIIVDESRIFTDQNKIIDARGMYVVPGLMDANVHLLIEITAETLARYEGQYEDLIVEAAQVALKYGVTTVFDSWGPRAALVNARDRINSGEDVGSRIYLAGNIVGYGGPFSGDFYPADSYASQSFIERTNYLWEQGVGRELLWMTPDQVVDKLDVYLEKEVDFIKYAASGHSLGEMEFITFSPLTQRKIVQAVHQAGMKVQTHTTSVESLRIAIEAGVDLLQHCDSTGPTPIPAATIKMLSKREVFCATLTKTKRRREYLINHGGDESHDFYKSFETSFINTKAMIEAGVKLLLSTDGSIYSSDAASHPVFSNIAGDQEDVLMQLGSGHVNWMKAMEEAGMTPMEILKSATINIAEAYGVENLGSIQPGKIADLLILKENPLDNIENYRQIATIIKGGRVIDRDSLPLNPLLTGLSGKQ